MLNSGKFYLFPLLFSLSHTASADEFTDTRRYQPFASAPLQETLMVKQRVEGQCHQGSLVTERADAWRCSAYGQSLDPCFVRRYKDRTHLLCPTSPWQQDAIEVVINHSLFPNRTPLDMSRALPWTVELTNGTYCRKLKPEEQNHDGEVKKYACNNGEYLVGDFYRCKNLWEIFSSNHGDYETVWVKRAWF